MLTHAKRERDAAGGVDFLLMHLAVLDRQREQRPAFALRVRGGGGRVEAA
jgi:hypothetical protein